MEKNFEKWNEVKIKTDRENLRLFYKDREVWWCLLGTNIGFEMDGKGGRSARPVLILKGFSKEVCLCLPLTTKPKKGKFYCEAVFEDGNKRIAILSQIRLIDTKRLLEKITVLDKSAFNKIKQALIRLIE